MSKDRKRDVTVQVAPYPDGSGYQAVARVYLDDAEGPVFDIDITYRLEAKHWPELRKAIDDALEFIAK
jgi:hypothetical protein